MFFGCYLGGSDGIEGGCFKFVQGGGFLDIDHIRVE